MANRGIYEVRNVENNEVIMVDSTLTEISKTLECSYNHVRKSAQEGRLIQSKYKVSVMSAYIADSVESLDGSTSPSKQWMEEWERVVKGAALLKSGKGRIVTLHGKKYVSCTW